MAAQQPTMTPQDFIVKWRRNRGQESAGAQEWFIDLCRVVEHGTPAEVDPQQEWYTFERAVREVSGRRGRADVYKRGYFAWEFKGLHRDLDAAYRQLQRYREALHNPPLLVASDFQTIRVHTNFTNKVPVVHTIALDDLGDPEPLEILRCVFHNPPALEPEITPDEITRATADIFSTIAASMRRRGVDPLAVARFLNRLVFCFFAQDVGLLPDRPLSQLCENFYYEPAEFDAGAQELFQRMNHGGRFGASRIRHFNGDLFREPDTVLLEPEELEKLVEATKRNWAHIEPSIFGTLFERVVDPDKEILIGAEYTTEADILSVIQPVIISHLLAEWHETQNRIDALLRLRNRWDADAARRILAEFQGRLASLKVLDPACGSGNFLYVALRQLHNLEKDLLTLAAELELSGFAPTVSPEQFFGIEIDPYASDLARTALWIGHLQWLIENGHRYRRNPVLGSLNTIECRDAIIDRSDPAHPLEPEWPAADYIVGNPPYLGHVPFRERLGDEYVDAVYQLYGDRIPNSSDLCCYWFEKARAEIAAGRTKRAGLLATQAIRFQSNRTVLERIKETGDIFEVVSDQEWKPNDPSANGNGNGDDSGSSSSVISKAIVNGNGNGNDNGNGENGFPPPANVHISIICFDDGSDTNRALDGEKVNNINADLTSGADLTRARRLAENADISFMGDIKVGPFEISREVAEDMLRQPNPNNRPNSDVIKRWMIGRDINQVSRDMYIIDFGLDLSEADAALYEAPFEYVLANVKPGRIRNRMPRRAERWWLHGSAAPQMRQALAGLPRYIGTSMVSRHRIFAYIDSAVLPDATIIVFARDDDYFFGILQSRIHLAWASGTGTQLEDRPRYTPTTCFETFPFPEPTDEQRAAIATAAYELNRLRENWLHPLDIFGNPALEPDQQRRRTLTNLYNQYPAWLANAHARLDAAVSDAYGWPDDLADGAILERLLDLNLARAES